MKLGLGIIREGGNGIKVVIEYDLWSTA